MKVVVIGGSGLIGKKLVNNGSLATCPYAAHRVG